MSEIKPGSTYRICEKCNSPVEGMFKCPCEVKTITRTKRVRFKAPDLSGELVVQEKVWESEDGTETKWKDKK